MEPPDNLLELFEIDPAISELPRVSRREPFPSPQQVTVGFDEPERAQNLHLDAARAGTLPLHAVDDRRPPPLSRQRRGQEPAAWAMAAGVYLVTLLLLLPWTLEAPPASQPIPVQLVLEQPKPPPPAPQPPPPKPEVKRPPGKLASDDFGDTAPAPQHANDVPTPPTPQPKETRMAAVQPPPTPPKPSRPSGLTSALPLPTPEPDPALALPDPDPPQEQKLELPPPKRNASARVAPNPHPPMHSARLPGADASRDEYLAYCAALIARNFYMLPSSFLGGREGRTILMMSVLDDGTIARVRIVHGSGYPDIDGRIEQMVAAVRRLPPVPQWFQGASMPLEYELHFPIPGR